MGRFYYFLFLWLVPVLVHGQARFIYSGTIEFERKINIQRQSDQDYVKQIVKDLPPFHNSHFSLSFDSSKTYYYPTGEMDAMPFFWLLGPAKENVVVDDLGAGTSLATKKVFEKTYLVSDSLNSIRWKISGETRTIAGFECRKAVGIICDSVYVVAFYAEEIPVSSGPESFNGLPGMILGIVIPRLYTNWFATKVSLVRSVPKIEPVKKAEDVAQPKLETVLTKVFQDWGSQKERNIWWTRL